MRVSTFAFAALSIPHLSSAAALNFPTTYRLPASPSAYPSHENTSSAYRAEQVKAAFKFAWDGYYKYAFPNDELKPVTNSFSNSRNGWGASAVDALSTAILMELPEVVEQVVAHIQIVDYTKTDPNIPVSLFETTIRYLGGMLSGYDLLKGPFAHLAPSVSGDEALDKILAQSKILADTLAYAFYTPSGLPYNNLYPLNRSTDNDPLNGPAGAGTLVLEWTRLSDLLDNPVYAALAQRAQQNLLHPKPSWTEPWPGLVGSTVNVTSGLFTDADGSWSGGVDSFYEYLLKLWIYDPKRFGEYRERWIAAADSTIAHLPSHPISRPDITWLAAYSGRNLLNQSQHLTCFDGGSFLLGGATLNEQKYIDFGLELVDGCHETYTATATGIGPEIFAWNTTILAQMNSTNTSIFFAEHGFFIADSSYVLRPEVIESYYHAYRVTKDPKYQDWTWQAFQSIVHTTKVNEGFSSIANVNVVGGGGFADMQESFLFAEVLKYCFMIFADQGAEWQVLDKGVKGGNKWVFNTEAHPVRVFGS
ncbi:glycoside hydrolase family 47 protein [Aulographum hederae CBS 113979]|uniref:alpha-1,2-Mannosidase n=1 Tax=Aulographum hederae CBS 113979 TaxID=1176131 RepID=A0A6G1H3C3_9PEZI|nr:glycoside hydrolase family 47 protein [Aulographum hederae CBS 113979]